MAKAAFRKIIDFITTHGKTTCRKLATVCGASKSSIDRYEQTRKGRSHIPGAEFFETTQGQEWLAKLLIATVFIFGIGAGVGSEKLSIFLNLVGIGLFAAVSTSSLKKLENKVDDTIALYQQQQDRKVKDKAANISITPGGDETFFENSMVLVCMDLASGFIFNETISEKRDHKSWEQTTTPWLSKFKVHRCFLSDKAKALLKLAKTTLKVTRIPDLFHMMNDVCKVMKFSFHRIRISKEKLLAEAMVKLNKGIDCAVNSALIADLTLSLKLLSHQQIVYQKNLRQLSTTLHPFEVLSNKTQTSSTVEEKMQASLSRIKAIQEKLEISDSSKRLKRVESEIPDAAKQIDMWWNWTNNSLESADIPAELKAWLLTCFLPSIYWKSRIQKTDSKKIKRCYKLSEGAALIKLKSHPLTTIILQNRCNDLKWRTWAEEISNIFIRATSAIEGRNSWLSQIHFNGRGFSQKRLISQCAIKNYFLERNDGTTACERLAGFKPENMFEFIVKNIGELAQPRKRKVKDPNNPLILGGVPA